MEGSSSCGSQLIVIEASLVDRVLSFLNDVIVNGSSPVAFDALCRTPLFCHTLYRTCLDSSRSSSLRHASSTMLLVSVERCYHHWTQQRNEARVRELFSLAEECSSQPSSSLLNMVASRLAPSTLPSMQWSFVVALYQPHVVNKMYALLHVLKNCQQRAQQWKHNLKTLCQMAQLRERIMSSVAWNKTPLLLRLMKQLARLQIAIPEEPLLVSSNAASVLSLSVLQCIVPWNTSLSLNTVVTTVASVASSSSIHPKHVELFCKLLERCPIPSALQVSIMLMRMSTSQSTLRLWNTLSSSLPNEARMLLLQTQPSVASARALRSTPWDVLPPEFSLLKAHLTQLQTPNVNPVMARESLLLLESWVACVPSDARQGCVSCCVFFLSKGDVASRVAAAKALAALLCDVGNREGIEKDAQYASMILRVLVVTCKSYACGELGEQEEDEEGDDIVALLNALLKMIEGGSPCPPVALDQLAQLWPWDQHPLSQSLALRVAAAIVARLTDCPTAVPEAMIRQALNHAFLLEETLSLWNSYVRCVGFCEATARLYPMLPFHDPGSALEIMDAYACVSPPQWLERQAIHVPLGGADDVTVALQKLSVLETLLLSCGKICCSAQELLGLLNTDMHVAVKCRTISLCCRLALMDRLPPQAVSAALLQHLDLLEEWLPASGPSLLPCLLFIYRVPIPLRVLNTACTLSLLCLTCGAVIFDTTPSSSSISSRVERAKVELLSRDPLRRAPLKTLTRNFLQKCERDFGMQEIQANVDKLVGKDLQEALK